ncbi:MAG: hypothetical protein CVT63_07510 [Candidatus Anoxymicrobium japonicum]|uniref:Serine aminopeptidase S33 domain-containing protein n=1 Tax=Candidatus Anoxymicrobium japonicum TaxID=2013648 RepID=A0A2N3G467_9ACTN|nr:MAG: hypothetical protein CVT63_07510 [Candidatus Anoxymicrobium japonicum]
MKKQGAIRWIILLATGIALVALGFVVVSGATGGVTYKRVTFTTEGFKQDPVTISGLLITPEGGARGKAPGVVFAHGITGSKELYVQIARQMAREGLVVLSIDLRGHGRSGGYCTYGYDEVSDVKAAGDYLRENVPEVDPAHITAMGHSLGGVTATRAGLTQPDTDKRFSSVVAIWCWTSWKDALEDMAGPLDNFTGRSWPFTVFSKHIDINSPETLALYNVIDSMNDTSPPNYMLAIGNSDELASVSREEQLIEKATVVARRSGPETKVRPDYTYGDFAAGTARRLVVTNDNHTSEMASGPIIRQSIDWIKQSAGLPVEAGLGAPFLWGRFIGGYALAIGIFLLALGALSLSKARLFPETGEIVVTPLWEYPAGTRALDVLIYALPVIAASYLAVPAAKAIGMKPFIPYAGVNEISMFSLARTFLLLPLFGAVLVFASRRAVDSGRLRERIQDGAARWAKSAVYALMPVGVTILLLLLVGGPLILPPVFAKLPLYYFVGVFCIGSAFWLEDYLFYKLTYRFFDIRDDPERGKRHVLLARAVILDLALIAGFLPLMSGPGISMRIMAFKAPVLIFLVLATPIMAVFASISLRLRRLTGGSIAFALMISTITVWFLTAPMAVRGF